MQRKRSKLTKSKMMNAVIAGLLILTLTSGNFFILGKEVVAVASDMVLNLQTEDTINKNVKFDTFFQEDNEKTHYLVCDVNEQAKQMYMNLSVQDGYLKNASIEFTDKNYTITEILDESQILQEHTNDKLTLKQVNSNTQIPLVLNVKANLTENLKLEDLNKESKVTLKGTYVDVEGKEIQIEKNVLVNVEVKQNIELELAQDVNSYFAFQKDGQNKVLVRTIATLSLTDKENISIPREETMISFEIPTLNGVKAESVNILPKNLGMTNGKSEEQVYSDNAQIEINEDNTIATITVANAEVNEKVWAGLGQDEYLVTYIYPEQALTNTDTTITLKTKAIVKPYNEEAVEMENASEFVLSEEIGSALSMELSTKLASINKGKMYANSIREEKEYKTEYSTQWTVDITSKEMTDGIRIEDKNEYFKTNTRSAYTLNDYTYYTETKVNKKNFEQVLGQDGTIGIYDENGNEIYQINSNTQIDEDGNYVVKYSNKVGRIILETSKPIAEGILYVKHNKVISEELPYEKEEIENFTTLAVTVSMMSKENNTYRGIGDLTMEIALEETTTNANIVIGRDVLSTIVTNENVEIKIELDNNRKETDLYENPVFLVELPEYIEDITVKEANVLFDENLQIQLIEKIEQEGKIFLRITLVGTQNGFSTGSFTKGTNIVLNTDIKAKLLTPNKSDEIKLYFSNENAMDYENKIEIAGQVLGSAVAGVFFSAPAGMLAVNSISNFENTDKTAISVNQGTVTEKIPVYAPAKTATMQTMIVNNTGNVCENVVALGRIPFKGNKNIESATELGTTVDTTLKSLITSEGIDEENIAIYYSENGEATTDLTLEANAWTQTPIDLSTIKSYLIVLDNYQMQTGETIKFNYNFEIPANLEHDNSLYGAFGVYFTNISDIGNTDERVIADIVGLTTGEGPKLDMIQIIAEGANQVTEGQYVTVSALIANKGSSDLENVVVREYIPQYAKYVEYKEREEVFGAAQSEYIYPETSVEEGTNKEYVDFEIGTIEPGGVTIVNFELYIDDIPGTISEYYQDVEGFTYDEETGKYYIYELGPEEADGSREILSEQEITGVPAINLINEMAVYAKDLENPLRDQADGITINKAYFNIKEKASVDRTVIMAENQELIYDIDITNIDSKTLLNVTAEKVLPEGLKYKEAYIEKYNTETEKWEKDVLANYDTITRKISWSIGTMSADETKKLKVIAQTEELAEEIYERELVTKTTVSADGVEKHTSMDMVNTVAKPNLEVTIKNDVVNEYIAEGDKITYTIAVRNNGKLNANNVKFEDVLPAELKFIRGDYITTVTNRTGKLNANDNKVTTTLTIKPEEEVTINIVAEAKNIPNNVDEVTIVNYASFKGTNTPLVLTRELRTRIEQSPTIPNPPDESPNTNGERPNNNNPTNNPTNNEPSTEKTYKIRGLAWIDKNQNGSRDADEDLLEGIKVRLVNASTGAIIKDKDSGEEKQILTAKDGSYTFENLEKGEYIVMFFYDNGIYGLTDYRKTNVAETQNSDVISSKITEENAEIEVAVTNTIKLNATSYANIDMGLIYNKKFDIKLDKLISKVTVQNKEGVKTYNYSDSTMGQVPITGKNIAGSIIVAEYKIRVTNEGNLAGYVKNIVDYMPKEMKFNSDLNPNWYAGNDGNLYNKELAEQIINPGQSKEITLILTKQMADNNTVIVNNLAEVYEDYNELGIKDIDSTAKNQAQGEDDLGSANVIITVRTGGAVVYTGIALVSLIILGAGIYIIRKKFARYYN